MGFEPVSRATLERSVSVNHHRQQFRSTPLAVLIEIGGDDGIRTHDPLLAGQVLSQLSYTPIYMGLLSQSSLIEA